MKFIVSLIFLLIISSCAPSNTKPINAFPAEGDFIIESPLNNGNARLYVYYPLSQAIKSHSTISVVVNKEILAIIRNRTFTKLELMPGEKLIQIPELNLSKTIILDNNTDYFLKIKHDTSLSYNPDIVSLLLFGIYTVGKDIQENSKNLILEKDINDTGIKWTKYIKPLNKQPICPAPVVDADRYDLPGTQYTEDEYRPEKLKVNPAKYIEDTNELTCKEVKCLAEITYWGQQKTGKYSMAVEAALLGADYSQHISSEYDLMSKNYRLYSRALKCGNI